MAKRLVICFDPERLLRPPCPALYPEWGREFILVSGAPAQAVWKQCATALAVADCNGVPVNTWLLASRSADGKAPDERAMPWSEAPTALAGRFAAFGRPRLVLWQHAEQQEVAPDASSAVLVRTAFGRPAPEGELELGRAWLLPIGLRCLLDMPMLLRAQPVPTGDAVQVGITATTDTLDKTLACWLANLEQQKVALGRSRDEQLHAPCKATLLRTDVGNQNLTAYKASDVRSLQLGWFQRLRVDDRMIQEWFVSESSALRDTFSKFQAALVEDFRGAVQFHSQTQPSVDAVAWAAGEVAQEDSADLDVSCESIRSLIVQKLSEQDGRPPSAGVPSSLEASLVGWINTHRPRVLKRARRRPTASVALFSFAACLLLFVAAWLWGFATPAGSPTPWPLLAWAAAIGGALFGLIGLVGVTWQWQRTRMVVSSARAELHQQVRRGFEAAADSARESARSALTAMLLGRNLDVVEQALWHQKTLIAQHEHHLDRLNDHLALKDERRSTNGTESRTSIDAIDPCQRPEVQRAYWWRSTDGQELARVKVASSVIVPAAAPEVLEAFRRLAGARIIEIGHR